MPEDSENWGDTDSWKDGDSYKPWEDTDGWKLDRGYEVGETTKKRDPKIMREVAYSFALRPTVVFELVDQAADVDVPSREAIKIINVIADKQLATTDQGEVFKYDKSRNLWILL